MAKVFVDTAAWLALINKDDHFHHQAKAVRDGLISSNAEFVTTDQVVLEVANSLSKRRFRSTAIRLIEAIYHSANIRVVSTDSYLWQKSWVLYKRSRDKDWSLTDCISFVVMHEGRIKEAFTTDRHFEQADFTKLLS